MSCPTVSRRRLDICGGSKGQPPDELRNRPVPSTRGQSHGRNSRFRQVSAFMRTAVRSNQNLLVNSSIGHPRRPRQVHEATKWHRMLILLQREPRLLPHKARCTQFTAERVQRADRLAYPIAKTTFGILPVRQRTPSAETSSPCSIHPGWHPVLLYMLRRGNVTMASGLGKPLAPLAGGADDDALTRPAAQVGQSSSRLRRRLCP